MAPYSPALSFGFVVAVITYLSVAVGELVPKRQGTDSGVFEEVEHDMVQKVLRLGDCTIKSLMTPRTDICRLDVEESLDENLQEILQCTDSRFPAGKGSLDAFAELTHQDIFSVEREVRDHTLAGFVMHVLELVSREADHFE